MSTRLIFVDCEGDGKPSPATGHMTEFGAVDYNSRETFYGKDDSRQTFLDFVVWLNDVCEGAYDDGGRKYPSEVARPVFVSDNPAYDWQWINYGFDRHSIENPFGHSARRIGDFYAGLYGDWKNTQGWKRFRVTPHDHNPVNDAMGNVEAFERIMAGER